MSLLSDATKAHENNELDRAIDCYKKHLLAAPNDFEAHQFLGIAFFNLNDISSAKLSFEKSLVLNENQPSVAFNLANCLVQLADSESAIQLLERVIVLDSKNLDAYIQLAKLYNEYGNNLKSIECLDEGLKLFPEQTKLLNQKVIVLKQDNQYPQAIKILEFMLESNPSSVNLRHNLGVILRLDGQSERALKQYSLLLDGGVKLHQLMHNTGNALSDLSRFNEAIDFYNKAISINIGYVDSHINLNNLLWELGQKEMFLKSFQKALIAEPSNKKMVFSYLKMLLQVSEFAKVNEILIKLDQSFKHCAQYYQLLGLSLLRLGKKIEALAAQKECLKFQPVNEQHQIDYARNLIETGNTKSAIPLLQKVIENNSQSQMAIAYLSSCWRISDDKREFEINNYDEIIKEYRITSIAGKDVESFCSDLKRYLETLHVAKNHPLEQTLIGGSQTKGNLFNDKNELLCQLVKEINDCVFKYCKEIKSSRSIDQDLKKMQSFHFTGSYSIRLNDSGFHVSHVHPMARLSLCFYVDVPNSVKGDKNHQGWLHIGAPNLDVKPTLIAERYIEPTVGKLVIMPSYVWHGTVPFQSDAHRLTVVCDIAPDK